MCDLAKQVERFGADSLLPDWKPPSGIRQIPIAKDLQEYLKFNCGLDVTWPDFRAELARRNTDCEPITIKHPLFKQLVEDCRSGVWKP